MSTAAGRLGTSARVAGGFALGAVMAVLLLPLAFAIALVLSGILVWSRLRGEDDQQRMTPVAAGFVAAVAAYVVLVLVSSVA